MPNLKSIICFNGGAGGDFLKAVCLTQFDISFSSKIDNNGMVEFDDHYFKQKCQEYYETPFDWTTIDQSRVLPVDNSHYYFDWFSKIASSIYFIDYPDNMTDIIVETCIDKRFQGNKDEFIKMSLAKMPLELQKIIPQNKQLDAIGTTWVRNQNNWRTATSMRSIGLVDLFDLNKLKLIVKEIVQKELVSLEQFEYLYYQWIQKNQHLLKAHT